MEVTWPPSGHALDKLQTPKTKFFGNTKYKNSNSLNKLAFVGIIFIICSFGYWSLFGIWCLEFL
jgi:hypothetical protein